jgi:hypothetical protein
MAGGPMGKFAGFWVIVALGVSAAHAATESRIKCKIDNGHLSGNAVIVSYDLKNPEQVEIKRDDLGQIVEEQKCHLVKDAGAAMAFDCEYKEHERQVSAHYQIRQGLQESACHTSIETENGVFELPSLKLSCLGI